MVLNFSILFTINVPFNVQAQHATNAKMANREMHEGGE
jgi:hypothetical protein